jgi:NTP pyrophosphatase (non-canonical NTP hydrolase)
MDYCLSYLFEYLEIADKLKKLQRKIDKLTDEFGDEIWEFYDADDETFKKDNEVWEAFVKKVMKIQDKILGAANELEKAVDDFYQQKIEEE